MKFFTIAWVAILTVAFMSSGLPGSAHGADTGNGEKVYKKCRVCHSLQAGKKKVGPSLHGLFGRTAGTFVDAKGKKFKHSKDMIAAGEAGLVWDAERFVDYIGKPKPYIGSFLGKKRAKTKMAFRGLKKQSDVSDLAAYLMPYLEGELEGK